MRKEVLWAIIAGITLGLVVAFGVYRINSAISSNKKPDDKIASTPKPVPTNELKVVLDKPNEYSVTTENLITVSGITKPNIWVTLSSEDSDFTIQSDKTGAFSQDVDLIPGVNQIKITVFDKNNETSSINTTVVYSSSFQKKDPFPKAYIGTVTDVTDSTIQIKNMESAIKQISINPQTIVINSAGSNNNKTVKSTDIAIGDFIVAMGYVNTNSVLPAQRILITDPITKPKIDQKQGKITDIDKKLVNRNTDIEIYKDGKMAAGKLSSIEDTNTLIYVTITDDKNVSSIRSIFKLSS